MPHPKYYNYEKWEFEEYQRKQQQQQQQQQHGHHGGGADDVFDDERTRSMEMRSARDRRAQEEFRSVVHKMSADRELRESMRRQEELRLQLTQAHKIGDVSTVKRLERLLAPDADDGDAHATAKHPWAQ